MPQRIENILEKNENVVWTGKPVKSTFMFTETPIGVGLGFMGISSLLLFAFSLFQPPIEIYLFISLFLVVGALMTFIPPILRLKRYPHMKYVITDRRLVVLSGKFAYNSVTFNKIQRVNVSEGFVDRLFGTGAVRVSGGPDFIALKNPDETQNVIRKNIQETVTPLQSEVKQELRIRCSICENLVSEEVPRYPTFPPTFPAPEFPMPPSYKCKFTNEVISRDEVETERDCEHFMEIEDITVLTERRFKLGT